MDSDCRPALLGLFLLVTVALLKYIFSGQCLAENRKADSGIINRSLTLIAFAIPAIWIIAKLSIVPQLLNLVIFQNSIDMETHVSSLLDLMRSNSVTPSIIQNALGQLKADIKHKHVPHSAVTSIFDIIRLALVDNDYLDLGFSTLGHLTKRLLQQRQIPLLESHARRTTPLLFELLDHEKERLRGRAVSMLADFSAISVGVYYNVESILRDDGLRSSSSRIVVAVCEWIIKVHQENILSPLRAHSFTGPLAECLKRSDSDVAIAAKNALIELFRNMTEGNKDDLRSTLRQRRIPGAIMEDIMSHITTAHVATVTQPTELPIQTTQPRTVPRPIEPEAQPARPRPVTRPTFESKHSAVPEVPTRAPNAIPTEPKDAPPTFTLPSQNTATATAATTEVADVTAPLPYLPEPSAAELEASQIEPLYVESSKHMDSLFADMLPHFAGKETEQNWTHREQSVLKIRRVTRGNAPDTYLAHYSSSIKSMVDGLVKGCTSLRTSLSTASCHCVQDVARKLKGGFDPMVEVLLQCFLKLCAATKKITSAAGNACVTELMACVTFTGRISQHLLDATLDKNVQPRLYATKWIIIVLTRYGRQRSVLDHNSDNLAAAITNGLNDRDKDVREAMRPTFWAFARLWKDKSQNLLSKMDKKQQDLVLRDAANPFPEDWYTAPSSSNNAPAKGPSTKPSIREAIAQSRLQKKAPIDRPGSAADVATPARDIAARIPARPKSSLMTTRRPALASSGSMSSAPVRPHRPVRKVDTKTDPKADTVPIGRPNSTPAAKSSRFLEGRTPAKASIKAIPAPKVEAVTITEPSTVTEPAAAGPDAQKRVSWSEDDLPVEFYSYRPSNEVGFASIGKSPTDPVDTITRNPGKGKTTDPVGQTITSSSNEATTRLESRTFRCPSDKPATLPVEPSEFPASEATHLSVDETFNIPAPELAAHLSPRMPRRSSLKSSNRPDLSKGPQTASDTTSVATHALSENTAQTSVEDDSHPREFGIATRLSQSPRPLASRKEANKSSGDSRPLRVYEDDGQVSEDIWLELALESPPSTLGAKAVLSELPINTEISKRRNSFSAKTTAYENIGVYQARQAIGRAIPRIKEGTIDQENLKDLRRLINRDSLWAQAEEGQAMFDELVLALVGVLHGSTSYADMAEAKLERLRLEAIYALQALNIKNKTDLHKWRLRIVKTLIIARNDYPDSRHIIFMMTKFLETLTDQEEQQDSLDCLLKLLESTNTVKLESHAIVMAIELITYILTRGNQGLSDDVECRLGRIACQALMEFDTTLRMAGTEMATKMFYVVKPESRYWSLMLDLSAEHKYLITYYVSRA